MIPSSGALDLLPNHIVMFTSLWEVKYAVKCVKKKKKSVMEYHAC